MSSAPRELGPMPSGRLMCTVDELTVRAPLETIFGLARRVADWPRHLGHYRYVRFERGGPDEGIVEMSAVRPFGPAHWPTWWKSLMEVDHSAPRVRFRHIGGITTGMDVAWDFETVPDGTRVRIVHVWDGPGWPIVGGLAAVTVIGPVFIHGIASRTLAGLAKEAERITAVT